MLQQCCRTYPGTIVVEALLILGWRELTLDNDNMAWMYNCKRLVWLDLPITLNYLRMCCGNDDVSISSTRGASLIMTVWRSFKFDRYACIQGLIRSESRLLAEEDTVLSLCDAFGPISQF